MPFFSDLQNRTYVCVLTLKGVIELRQHGINIDEFATGDLLDRLGSDPELLVKALYIVASGSIQAHGLTPDDFAANLGGDTLARATDALLDAIVLFFRPSQRLALQQLLQKARDLEQLAGQQLLQALEQVTPESILTASNTATNSPALSDSTRTR